MARQSDAATAWFDPFSASSDADPYALYRRLRDESPVYRWESDGDVMWVVSRYDDVNSALNDWQSFSSVRGDTHAGSRLPLRSVDGGHRLLETDPPRHDELRSAIRDRFSPKAVQLLERDVREAAASLIERAHGRETLDVAGEFAWPLALDVVSDLIGIPGEDRATVVGWYQTVVYSESEDVAIEASRRFTEYFEELATERRSRPCADLMSELMLLTARGALTREGAIVLALEIFEGGVDVPANLIANAVLALASHPHARARLATPALDARSVRTAIEEFARYDAPIQALPRTAVVDVDRHGATIPSGSLIWLLLGSANRDERRFPEPDILDIERPPTRNLAFGSGPHFCIGAPLARLVAGVALPMLLNAFPTYEVVGPVDRPSASSVMRALLNLRIASTCDPAQAA